MALSWEQIVGILLIIGTLYLRSRSEDNTPMPTGKAIEVDKYSQLSVGLLREREDIC